MRSLVSQVALAAALVSGSACGGDVIAGLSNDQRNRSIAIAPGEELDIMLAIVGGQFESPPVVSSGAIRFIDVKAIPPFLPSGPNLQFRFQGIAPGVAIVTFRTGEPFDVVVQDTVIVRP